MDLAFDPFDGGPEPDPLYAAQVLAQAFGYTYDSLDHTSTQIRLLTLFPARDKSSPLMGQLCTANLLPTSPLYEALSYVWRNPYEISLISVLSTGTSLHRWKGPEDFMKSFANTFAHTAHSQSSDSMDRCYMYQPG